LEWVWEGLFLSKNKNEVALNVSHWSGESDSWHTWSWSLSLDAASRPSRKQTPVCFLQQICTKQSSPCPRKEARGFTSWGARPLKGEVNKGSSCFLQNGHNLISVHCHPGMTTSSQKLSFVLLCSKIMLWVYFNLGSK
jgi:hypothetical protein